MIDIFHEISAYLETFLTAISGNFWLTFFFIFAVAIGEALFVVGLFVPSTPVLLLVGGIIAEGRLPFWEVYIAAVVGAIIGDALSYGIGHMLSDTIKEIWPFKYHRELIVRGEKFFALHGGKSVFIGRFIPGVKAVIPGVAGIMGMSYRRFTIINVTSAFVWAAAHILPGMLLTAWLKSIGLSMELVIVVGTLVLTALFILVHYHRTILLALAPWLGGFGRSIENRWRKPDVGKQ
ncbi:DedA family protein [Devosia rhodophyticola]|uniref:DedA family protein n=1 Tax=Devosia rhodophyticola TaxID=3026423 RepID=A0ABY7YTW1_9HYPH|nr:DedA family protein [Devosia rhodophyticola]WDR04818.1 DedA family protein [Devosia rhodophyticola]